MFPLSLIDRFASAVRVPSPSEVKNLFSRSEAITSVKSRVMVLAFSPSQVVPWLRSNPVLTVKGFWFCCVQIAVWAYDDDNSKVIS